MYLSCNLVLAIILSDKFRQSYTALFLSRFESGFISYVLELHEGDSYILKALSEVVTRRRELRHTASKDSPRLL